MAALTVAFGTVGAWRRRVPVVGVLAACAITVAGLPAEAAVRPAVAAAAPTTSATAEAGTEDAGPLTAPDVVSAAAIARLEDQPVEVLAERTEFGSVYVLPDGTMASGTGSGPVWVRQGDGDGTADEDWAPVDLTLVADEDGSVRPVAHSGDLVLAGGSTADPATGTVRLAQITDPATGITTAVHWDGDLPDPELSGRRATYREVEPGVDLVVEATSTGMQEFFVVAERPDPTETLTFPLTVTADGAALEATDDGAITVVGDGEVVASAPAPMMWDAASDLGRAFPITQDRPAEDEDAPRLSPMPAWVLSPDHGASVDDAGSATRADADAEDASVTAPVGDTSIDPLADAVEVERTVTLPDATTAQVALAPQDDFLQDPATEYPVVVDPDVNLNWGFDTYVLKGYSNNRSEEYELRAGTYNGGTNVARSYIHFPMGQFAGRSVSSARIELFNFYSWSCQARNWQVWNVYAASTGSTWANQPGWATHYATSSETHGYSGSCPGGWSNANITGFAQMWAASNETEGHVGIKAESETDNYGWKRFYSSNNGAYIPSIWVTYNSTPNTPTGLKISNTPNGAVSGAWTGTKTPTLSATVSDPDGGLVHGNFTLTRYDTGQVVYTGSQNNLPSGSVASVTTPTLVENGVYYFTVRTSDNIVESPPTAGFWFRVDTIAPLAPTVTSTDYPNDGTWHKAENQAGAFTIKPPVDASLSTYRWGLDKAPDPAQTVAATTTGAATTLNVTPTTPGKHVLQIQAVDLAGNVSGIVKYTFHVGRGGIVTPEDDARVVRRARLQVTGEPVFTHLKFQWRRGPDSPAADIKDVPLAQLTTSAGSSWQDVASSGWAALPQGDRGYTTWDVGATLGYVGGPIQVRAVLATSSVGAGSYAGGWTTLTVDPDASGAATTEVGPASVNLLTGDSTLTVTDAEEFGLSVARTISSRDTDAGYELQADKLTTAQSQATSITGVVAGNASPSVDTTRFHTGTTSYKVTPSGTSVDSFLTIGPDGGSMALGMQAGRTYRISGWVYVPSQTGLTPGSIRGLRMTVFTRSGTGPYSEPVNVGAATPKPTMTDAWQQVSMDVTIPAGTTEAFLRLYNGNSAASKPVYWDDVSLRELWSPFGKQWSAGTADAAAGTAYTRISKPYDDVAAVHLTGGGEIWFSSGNGTQWWPEPGAEDLTLTPTSATSWRLTEIDGTTTDFVKTATSGADFLVTVTAPPAAAGATRHVYDASVSGQARLTRIIAPIEDGVDGWPTNTNACNPATGVAPARGCEVMDLVYATSTTATATTLGTITGQVDRINLWGTDPATGAVSAVTVTRYLYDAQSRLTQVWDPRIGTSSATAPGANTLVTTYAYDSAGRITSVTAPGEEPFRFGYGTAGATTTGTGDFIDASTGRLLTVSRRSLEPGTTDQWGPDNVSTVVYGVPTTRTAGGPYDLGPEALATWAQMDGPTDATAVFGPQDPPGVTSASATVPGKDGYKPATVHYLNASGQEVNTASPLGLDAPVEGYIDTTEYDNQGKVVRTLDATNRLLALGKLAESADLASWNLGGTGSVYLSQVLDTRTTYTADGLDVRSERGPAQQLAVANDPDTVQTLHAVTRYVYDEGKPDGVAYHLVTTSTSGGLPVGADLDTATLLDPTTTVNAYTPVDGAAVLGGSSGWVHKQPTSVTVDAGQPTALTSTVVYDTKGRPLRSSKPGSTGSDAGTTLSILYTAGANPTDASCGNRPEWAGQPCVTRAAGAVTGHDAALAASQLPVKRVDAYNRYGTPTSITESATGPLAGSTVTHSRSTVTTYDTADRVTRVQISGTGAGVGEAIAATSTEYDARTGDVLAMRSVDASGATIDAVTKTYDLLGQVVAYTDADGSTNTITYNRWGNPESAVESVTDALGTRQIGSTTYRYDRAKDPRGVVTSFTDSVAGTVSASWGPDGQLESETLPGDVRLDIDYDPARVPVRRTYVRASDDTVIATDSVVENHRGQWTRHVSSTGSRDYSYDRLGRLVEVEDTGAMSGVCTTRSYTYDSHTNRVGSSSVAGEQGQACPAAGASTVTSTFDTADRLVSSSTDAGGTWAYDPLGRVVSMPSGDQQVSNGYYVNDRVASQEIAGQQSVSWGIDPLLRRATFTSRTWSDGAWSDPTVKTSHYTSDSDEPSWIQEDANDPAAVTRYVGGVEGDVAVTTSLTGDRELQLVDLHGDIVATLPIADGADTATWTGLAFTSFDEFGVAQPMSGSGATNAPPARYGWLGAAQRSAEALGGVILMGARLYSPTIGRFLSIDPVAGGSANAYDYCNADPVNCTDLAGTWSWKGVLKAVAVVADVASMVPGPIGAAAGLVAAGAYYATGDKQQALFSAAGAAASLIGAGPLVKGARALTKALKPASAIGEAASKAAPKMGRVFWTGGEEAKRAATAFAQATGRTTIGMTRTGRVLEKVTAHMPWKMQKPIWRAASASFARGARGEAHVFIKSRTAWGDPARRSIWMRTERPILRGRGVSIRTHVLS
jgi:RHS repeat-associated protein